MGKCIIDIKVTPVWLWEESNFEDIDEVCIGCNDGFSHLYRLWIMSDCNGVRLPGDKTKVVLCASCFAILNKFEEAAKFVHLDAIIETAHKQGQQEIIPDPKFPDLFYTENEYKKIIDNG